MTMKKLQTSTASPALKNRPLRMKSIYQELAKKHGSSSIYSNTQLRLWARLIQSGSHDDYEDPPRVPADNWQ